VERTSSHSCHEHLRAATGASLSGAVCPPDRPSLAGLSRVLSDPRPPETWHSTQRALSLSQASEAGFGPPLLTSLHSSLRRAQRGWDQRSREAGPSEAERSRAEPSQAE
jgi:hypothetical protein